MVLIQHHVKYKEIHGYDEIVWMTWSEHQKLHKRLRKEGKCNIPADELQKISTKAHKRTKKWDVYSKEYKKSKQWKEYIKNYRQKDVYKEQSRKYEHTIKRREYKKKYNQSDKYKEFVKKYNDNKKNIEFYESMGENILFCEMIVYNYNNGSVYYYDRFRGVYGTKLPKIDI